MLSDTKIRLITEQLLVWHSFIIMIYRAQAIFRQLYLRLQRGSGKAASSAQSPIHDCDANGQKLHPFSLFLIIPTAADQVDIFPSRI